MPAKSKAQQKFMGMVHAAQKGEKAASAKVAKVAKRMKKKDAEDYASTKHKGLPTKVKKEDLIRLISKYGARRVKETIMAVRPKSVTVSGSGLNRKPEEPDFEYDPEDVDEGFGGELKGKDKKEFEKARKENAEVLGYEATGTSDTKKQTLKMAHQLKEARSTNREWNKFEKAFGDFFKTVLRLGKANTKLTGNKTDEKIFIKNFNRDVGKFYSLMQSWIRGQNESVNEADLGLTYKKGKTVKVKHKSSGKRLVIVDKPAVRKEYEKIGYFAESVNESKFTSDQIELLKMSWNTLKGINPSSPTYKKFIKFLDKLPKDELKQLANAKIKFVSILAKNRIKGESVNELREIIREELQKLNEISKGKKLINKVFRKYKLTSTGGGTTRIRGYRSYADESGSYEHDYEGLVSIYGIDKNTFKKIVKDLERAGLDIDNAIKPGRISGGGTSATIEYKS